MRPTETCPSGHPPAMVAWTVWGLAALLYLIDATAYQAGFSLMAGSIVVSLCLLPFARETYGRQGDEIRQQTLRR